MNIRALVLGCAFFALAACSGGSDPEVQKEKHLKAKGTAINVEFNDKNQASAVIGFRATPVRTVITSSDQTGNGKNLKNVSASCKLVGDGYAATVTTPASVNLPSFGKDMKPLVVSCTYKDKVFSETLPAVNLSKGSRDGAAVAVGVVLCPICGVATAVANGGERGSDVFGFGDIQLNVD